MNGKQTIYTIGDLPFKFTVKKQTNDGYTIYSTDEVEQNGKAIELMCMIKIKSDVLSKNSSIENETYIEKDKTNYSELTRRLNRINFGLKEFINDKIRGSYTNSVYRGVHKTKVYGVLQDIIKKLKELSSLMSDALSLCPRGNKLSNLLNIDLFSILSSANDNIQTANEDIMNACSKLIEDNDVKEFKKYQTINSK